jgi:hypothetical protein
LEYQVCAVTHPQRSIDPPLQRNLTKRNPLATLEKGCAARIAQCIPAKAAQQHAAPAALSSRRRCTGWASEESGMRCLVIED